MELGRGLLPCSVLESRPELSPQGGLGAGRWVHWSPIWRWDPESSPQHQLHGVDFVSSFGRTRIIMQPVK